MNDVSVPAFNNRQVAQLYSTFVAFGSLPPSNALYTRLTPNFSIATPRRGVTGINNYNIAGTIEFDCTNSFTHNGVITIPPTLSALLLEVQCFAFSANSAGSPNDAVIQFVSDLSSTQIYTQAFCQCTEQVAVSPIGTQLAATATTVIVPIHGLPNAVKFFANISFTNGGGVIHAVFIQGYFD